MKVLAGDENMQKNFGMPKDNKEFHKYMCKGTYWTQLIELAMEAIQSFAIELQQVKVQVPNDALIYFKSCWQLHFKDAFHSLNNNMKSSLQTTRDDTICASSYV